MSTQLIEHEQSIQLPPQPPEETLPVQSAAASPLDLPVEVFRSGLDRRRENRSALMDWVRGALVEGVDYGRIHIVKRDKCSKGKYCTNPAHFSKPSLWKPGAEKICGMLGVSVHFPTLHDYEQAALHGVDLKNIIVRCEIKDASGAGGRRRHRRALTQAGLRRHQQGTEDGGEVCAHRRDIAHGRTLRGLHPGPGGHGTWQGRGSANQRHGKRSCTCSKTVPDSITAAQRKALEARIGELGLDPQRVKDWLNKATHGRVTQFDRVDARDVRATRAQGWRHGRNVRPFSRKAHRHDASSELQRAAEEAARNEERLQRWRVRYAQFNQGRQAPWSENSSISCARAKVSDGKTYWDRHGVLIVKDGKISVHISSIPTGEWDGWFQVYARDEQEQQTGQHRGNGQAQPANRRERPGHSRRQPAQDFDDDIPF